MITDNGKGVIAILKAIDELEPQDRNDGQAKLLQQFFSAEEIEIQNVHLHLSNVRIKNGLTLPAISLDLDPDSWGLMSAEPKDETHGYPNPIIAPKPLHTNISEGKLELVEGEVSHKKNLVFEIQQIKAIIFNHGLKSIDLDEDDWYGKLSRNLIDGGSQGSGYQEHGIDLDDIWKR